MTTIITRMGYMIATAEIADNSLKVALETFGETPLDAYVENSMRADGLRLLMAVQPETASELVCTWPSGRLFNQAGELRWERRRDGGLHLVMIGEGDLPSQAQGVVVLHAIDDAPYQLLLWGERQRSGWQEDRIPQLGERHYQGWPGPYAAIAARTYETEWLDERENVRPEFASVRIVTRYLAYVPDHRVHDDLRFRIALNSKGEA